MALVSCIDCGTAVSDLAPACPSCGRPVSALKANSTGTDNGTPSSTAGSFAALEFGSQKKKTKATGRRPVFAIAVIVFLSAAAWGVWNYSSNLDEPSPSTGESTDPTIAATLEEYLPSTGRPSNSIIATALQDAARAGLKVNGFEVPAGAVAVSGITVDAAQEVKGDDGLERYLVRATVTSKLKQSGEQIANSMKTGSQRAARQADVRDISSIVMESALSGAAARNALANVPIGSEFEYHLEAAITKLDGKWEVTEARSSEASFPEGSAAATALAASEAANAAADAALNALYATDNAPIAPEPNNISTKSIGEQEVQLPDRDASILFSPAPKYPPAASRAGISGRVVVEIDFDRSGNLTNVTIFESSRNRDLDRSAMDVVRKWKFSPAVSGGVPVAGKMRVPITFDAPAINNAYEDQRTAVDAGQHVYDAEESEAGK